MIHLNKYNDFEKMNEVESMEIPIDSTKTSIFSSIKDPEEEYEKILGRKGQLSIYLRKNGKKFTFGVLKNIFKDAVEYKKKRELVKGTYKMLHRAIPMALAFISFPVWLVGNILGASRALNKVIQPLLKNPDNNYNSFLIKVIKGSMAIMEGEIKYVIGNDWFYDAFVMEDDLINMVRKDVLRIFAIELANKMEKEDDDKVVPHHYVENELKKFLNERFNINPAMKLKN
jgi:hypothetical protein